jgi:6-phosphogluconate dehydrogenase
MTIGILGLGKMGSRIAQKLYQEGHEVAVWNRTFDVTENFAKSLRGPAAGFPPASAPSSEASFNKVRAVGSPSSGVTPFKTIEELISKLSSPKIVWLMLPAGEATEDVLNQLKKYLQKDDIVIDGGNANFNDTQRRYQDFRNLGIEFLGIGVSGGLVAFKDGYPLMVGGSKKAYDSIISILDSLSKPNGGHQYFGEGGAGHFVKMVHNGIEYGIMQSLGEGFEVLQKSQYSPNLLDVAKLWQKGTLVCGFMLDRAVDALSQNQNLENMEGPIAESGEARWTIEEAKKEGVQTEIIEASLNYRTSSQTDEKIQKSFTAKMINGLRSAFGGHEIKK